MLGIVLINYNSEKEVITYITTELSKIKTRNVITVVNNSYTKEGHESLERGLRQIESRDFNTDLFLITKKDNLGYARANNFGAEFLKTKFDITHFLFSNTDITLKDTHVVEALIQKLNKLPKEFAAIGPRVLSLEGRDQSPHPKISFARYAGWKLLPFLRKKSTIKQEDKLTKPREGSCYWVSGCFILVKAKDFFKADGFDPNTFLYGEEMILAERLKQINRSMYFFPKKEIIHFEGAITQKKHNVSNIYKLAEKSKMYYYNTYIGIPKFITNIIGTI